MFFTRYSPAYPDMFDYNTQQLYRPCQARRQAMEPFSPQDFLALLNPWEALQGQRRYGGKMCRRNSKAHGCHTKGVRKIISVTEEPWQTSVKADGFEQKDFTIFLRGRTVVIHGRQSEGNEESGIVSKEFRKNVDLPKDLIMPSLDVNFEDGNVLISGKRSIFKESERNEEGAEKQISRPGDHNEKEDEETSSKEVEVSITTEDCQCDSKDEESCKSKCENCDCSAKSESDVTMEDIGSEEEIDGVRMEVNETEGKEEQTSLTKTDVNDTVEVGDKPESSKDSKKVEEHCQEVAKKSEDSSESCSAISEYKPIQWSIPFEGFDANDVRVRLEDNTVRVFAEHKEEKDGITFFRRTERSFALPQNADTNTLTSRFNTDEGKLTIQVLPDKRSIEKNQDEEATPQNCESHWMTMPIMFM